MDSRAGLVAAFLLSLSPSLFAQNQKPDLILYNGRVATVDKRFSIVEAVAIGAGEIVAVGGNADVRALADASTEQVDLRGRLVTPGFVDAHPHLVHIGSSWFTSVSLSGARSIAESAPGGWIAVGSLGGPPPVGELPGALQEKRWPNKHDLDAVERVDEHTPVAGLGWVLNHVSFATRERIERVRKLGLLVTSYSASEYGRDAMEYARVFGPETGQSYASMTTPFGWWLDAGVEVAFGTDSAANPMFTMWHALTRENRRGLSLMAPGKTITREQALRMATLHGARVMGWDDRIGSIVNGKLADLVVHDVDLLTCTDDELENARPAATLVAGRVVHGRLD